METTLPTLRVTKEQFDLHTRLFNNVLEEINESDANNQLNEHINHIKWLAGHLTTMRMGMYTIGGFNEDKSYDDFFSHGKSIDANLDYPELESIVAKWNEISSQISTGFENLPEEALNTDAPIKTPVSDPSLAAFLGFLMHHEAYHIGQIGILRKYIGKNAMSYD